MLRTHRSLKAYCATLWWRWRERWSVSFIFSSNGAPVEWNWQAKIEVLVEKSVPVPLCSPQIPHGLTRDETRASAVRGWRLTAWAMARLCEILVSARWAELARPNEQNSVDACTLLRLSPKTDQFIKLRVPLRIPEDVNLNSNEIGII
jgi:hypothetical protein